MVRQRLSSGTTPQRLSFGNASMVTMSSGKEIYSAKSDAKSGVSSTPADKALATRKRKRKHKVNWEELNDSNFGGFEIHTATVEPSKKQSAKRQKTDTSADNNIHKNASTGADIVQSNPFDKVDLSVTHNVIKPAAEWQSMRRYKNFTLTGEQFKVGENVWVKTANDRGEEESPTLEAARILEVRAGDAAHVYVRIYWLYKPEELPGGRKPYHGECELIASNHMDVIEATNVEDRADVVYWDDDTSWRPEEGQYFFRQTYDVVKSKSKQLSNLRKHCIDKAPSNPDEPLVQCPSCSEWLHSQCLEEKAIQDAGVDIARKKGPGRPKKNRKSLSTPTVEAEIGITKSGKTSLKLIDKRLGQNNRQWHVDVKCLSCNAIIEKANEGEEVEEEEEEANILEENHNNKEDTTAVASKPETLKAPTKDQDKATVSLIQSSSAPTQTSSKAKQSESQATCISNIAKPPADFASEPNARKRKRAVSSSLVIGSTSTPVPMTGQTDPSAMESGIQSVKRLLFRSA